MFSVHNIYLGLGYLSHDISFLILLWAILSNRSAEGISLITQVLYVIVFFTRYMHLFAGRIGYNYLTFFHKLFYIFTTIFIVFLMTKVYPRTREREKAWKFGAYCLVGAIVACYPVTVLNVKKEWQTFEETMYTLSIILESVCVLPQLLLLRQTTVPTVIDSFYLVALGLYRALYIPNWIVKSLDKDLPEQPDYASVIFGILQTALYLDFAWVYWTRQRVKLRGGGVVDSDDISRGWILGSVLNRKGVAADADTDEESDPLTVDHDGNGDGRSQSKYAAGRWGPRGISVSADDTLPERQGGKRADGASDGLTDPNAFEDDDDDDDKDGVDRNDKNNNKVGGGPNDQTVSSPSGGDDPESRLNHQVEWQETRNHKD